MTTIDPMMSVEDVNQEIAAMWLLNSKINRRIRPRQVKKYAADMRAGKWLVNGETIKFDVDGHLVDGQHRLAAVAVADTTIRTYVVRGVSSDAQTVMDTGITRSLSDVLTMNNEHDTTALAALLRVFSVYMIDNQLRSFTIQPQTNFQLLEQFSKNPDRYRIASRRGRQFAKECTGPASIWSLAYLNISQVVAKLTDEDRADVDVFFDELLSGENLGPNDPRIHLRRRVRSLNNGYQSTRGGRREIYALIIKAWNLWRDGVEITNLRVRLGGRAPEMIQRPH